MVPYICLVKKQKNIIWSCKTKTKVYDAYHEINQQHGYNYLDVNTDDEGKIYLCHHSFDSTSEKITWSSDDANMHDFVKSQFGDDTIFSSFDTEMDLNFQTGRPENMEPSSFIRVKRFSYSICKHSLASLWRVNFSVFKVSFFHNAVHSFDCCVRHTFTTEEFTTFCKKKNYFQFLNTSMKDSSLEDIALIDKLEMKRFKKEDPKVPFDGSEKMFKGDYLGVEVVIEQVANKAGIARKFETLISSNQHENLVRFFGGERNEDGNLILAFERYPFNLYKYLQVTQNLSLLPSDVNDIIRYFL